MDVSLNTAGSSFDAAAYSLCLTVRKETELSKLYLISKKHCTLLVSLVPIGRGQNPYEVQYTSIL